MRLLTQFQDFLVLGLAVSAVAFTIARTKITEPLRRAVMAKNKWFGNLIGCPYCLSHWLCFGAVLTYQVRIINQWYPLDLLVSAMAMVALSAFIVGQIQLALTR